MSKAIKEYSWDKKPVSWKKDTRDGYSFFAYIDEYDGGKINIAIGCRRFSIEEAEAHWTKPISYWVGDPRDWSYLGYDSAKAYNQEASDREKINQERLNYTAQAVNFLERRK